jgi:type IV pilus assembly protein PilA
MKRMQQGFTLIELMIVVAIIGILAAIAIPAYQDYITRSKVTELVTAADACKTSVSEYYQSQNTFPATQTVSGCANASSQYVASLTVTGGNTITVKARTGTNALPTAAAGNFVLVGAGQANGQVTWTCNTSTIPKKYLPANCR